MDCGNEPQLRYILSHEFIHIKRLDALWKLILVIVLCCHWFNPLVWLLYVLMNRDLEISCDEKVILEFGEDTKTAYAMSLIGMAEHRTGFTPLYSNFSKNATEERILSIMKFRKTSVISLILAVMLVAGATTVFADNTADKIMRVYGIMQTDSGIYSFELDEKGVVTVRDADGKVVSTTRVDKDGKVDLTDSNGNVIKTIQLRLPIYKQDSGTFLAFTGASPAEKTDEADIEKKLSMLNGGPPQFSIQADGTGSVVVKDGSGKVVCKGTADDKGMAVLTDDKGEKAGTASVNNGVVTRLSIFINGDVNKKIMLWKK